MQPCREQEQTSQFPTMLMRYHVIRVVAAGAEVSELAYRLSLDLPADNGPIASVSGLWDFSQKLVEVSPDHLPRVPLGVRKLYLRVKHQSFGFEVNQIVVRN